LCGIACEHDQIGRECAHARGALIACGPLERETLVTQDFRERIRHHATAD
jgi:hypothetical protein